jgi:dipeptidase E
MKLVLYSGGQSKSNHHLHRSLIQLGLESRKQRVGRAALSELEFTYIPFCSDDSTVYFNRAKRRYRTHGVENFHCMNVDRNPSREEWQRTFQSDIIYLAGGNTFYFLKHLRAVGALTELRNFAQKGGVIAGLSAGALILSPTVRLAADEGLGPDENEVGLKNFKGVDLFGFEFSPHYEKKTKLTQAHLAYSLTTPYPVFAVEDGSGMVINGDDVAVHGNATVFYRGAKTVLK